MNIRKIKEILAEKTMLLFSAFIVSLLFIMAFGLFWRALPIISFKPIWQILFSPVWNPSQGNFGLLSFIIGTLWVTAIAVIISVPLSLLTAIYLAEYANKKVRDFSKPLIDVLAGISPVIYGVWGIIAIVPLVRDYLMPFFSSAFPFFPFKSDNFTGFSALTAGIVLAVMVFPVIVSVIFEVINTVSIDMKNASLAIGATKWETVKYVVLNKGMPGIIAAIILGLSRAFGETIAVLMVAGCSLNVFPGSIFDTAYPLPALIANTYGEMMSIPLYDAAVLLSALILLVVTALFNMVGWGILLRLQGSEK